VISNGDRPSAVLGLQGGTRHFDLAFTTGHAPAESLVRSGGRRDSDSEAATVTLAGPGFQCLGLTCTRYCHCQSVWPCPVIKCGLSHRVLPHPSLQNSMEAAGPSTAPSEKPPELPSSSMPAPPYKDALEKLFETSFLRRDQASHDRHCGERDQSPRHPTMHHSEAQTCTT
jgi:hypothetical protein